MKKKKSRNIADILIRFVGFTFPVLYYPLSRFENYEEWVLFPSVLIVSGVILGTLLSRLTGYFVKDLADYKSNSGLELTKIIIGVCVYLSIIFGVVINENLGNTAKIVKFRLYDVGMHSRINKPQYIFIINKENKVERFNCPRAYVNKVKDQEFVSLQLNRGCFGFEYYSIPNQKEFSD